MGFLLGFPPAVQKTFGPKLALDVNECVNGALRWTGIPSRLKSPSCYAPSVTRIGSVHDKAVTECE